MNREQRLRTALLEQIREQIERTAHLTTLLPADGSLWRPPVSGAWPAEGFALLADADLATPISTVFVPHGEPLLTLLLGNLEHLINHKHELFTCLKQMGAEVNTSDLYCFRGATD